jgi:hypothetical protein
MRFRYPAAIAFRSFNQKSGLPSQYQQVFVAANQQISFTALSQVQKRLTGTGMRIFLPARPLRN